MFKKLMTPSCKPRVFLPHFQMLIIACLSVAYGAKAAEFRPYSSTAAGEHGGIEFVEHFGLFAGTTAKGDFVMPYRIIAPAIPGQGNGAVLIEPPHFAFGAIGLDAFLGNDVVLGRGFSHASVGFSELLLNILAPIPGLEIAGEPAFLCDPGTNPNCTATRDVEIIKQFTEALVGDPWARSVLGDVSGRYAYGASQTAEVLNEMMYGYDIEGLFDFILLMLNVWQLEYSAVPTGGPEPGVIPDVYVPVDGIGKVITVNAEGDQYFSGAEHVRNGIYHPGYRVYEVVGAPHFASIYLPPGFPGLGSLNPLDVGPVGRAAFVAGHRWAAEGVNPPNNAILFGTEYGIARDADGNALGGVRLPKMATGRGRYIAWIDVPLPLPGGGSAPLLGAFVDLACAPPAGSQNSRPRFRNHGSYVSAYAREANRLVRQGYLLPGDAEQMIDAAGESGIGKPGSCD
jgi:hypothetical protein